MFATDRAERGDDIRRILIVEDDALIAFDNEHALNDAGFSVVAAVDNAADALRLIAGGGIDLVMSDVNLRGEGDGVDVARAARDAGIVLLFVSGHCPVDAQGLAIGCLAKPYTQRDLLGSIEVVAATRSGRRSGSLPRALTLYRE